MNVFVLSMLIGLCTVFAILVLPSEKMISRIVIPLLICCATMAFAAGLLMPHFLPRFSEKNEEVSPLDEIMWSGLSYQVTPSGYHISYRDNHGWRYQVLLDESEDAVSRCATKRVLYGSDTFYSVDKERCLFLSKQDYQAVTDWIDRKEQQKAKTRAAYYYRLNQEDS